MYNNEVQFTRRQFIRNSLAVSASVALLGLPEISAAKSGEKPPNFIIIFADDLGYADLSCYGAKEINTPRLDQMAAEGIKFTDFYSAAPVCTPSRAALLTGCYPKRVGLPTVLRPNAKVGLNPDEITIADVLKSKGYATACIGKWHLGDNPRFMPTKHGFDYFFGLPYSNDMKPLPLMRGEKVIEQPVLQETLTERYTQEAIRFITENKDRPFFLYLPHTFPHIPLHISDEFKDKSKRGLYGDVVERIDWSTGEILDTLKKLGLDENTMVVFTSDNGPWLIQGKNGGGALPLRDGKSTCWEGGMREPCIMRWPGRIPDHSVCSEVATMMDLYPTMAKLAGAGVPQDRIVDGKDIRPLVFGTHGAQSPYHAFFYYRVNELWAVRSGRWKLMLEHTDKKSKAVVPQALYDLQEDIGETTDVSARYPKLVNRLLSMAEQCREDLGDAITGKVGKNCRPAGSI